MVGNITIFPVAPNDFIARWDKVEPMLDKAMPVDMRRYLPIDILVLLIQDAGRHQGWFVLEDNNLLAVLVTRIDQFPRRRGLSLFCLSGIRMKDWFEKANEILTEYGRRTGCDHMEVCGRQGWSKVLDLHPHAIVLTKDIEGGLNA